jgi:gliding motility-associated-like protein
MFRSVSATPRNMRCFSFALIYIFVCILSIDLVAQANNSRPEITGQTPSPLVTTVNRPITIELTNLIVVDTDPQPVYPNGFTLELSSGRNYRINGNVVTPDQNFTGLLSVPVRVDDGRQRSRRFDVEIEVRAEANEVPEITGQVELTIRPGQSLEILLSHLTVNDPDDNYPGDFDLQVFNGNNYNRDRNTITPRSNFTGTLSVPVSVNDGVNESSRYNLLVTVADAENIVPVITGHDELMTKEETPLTIRINDLHVTDPDDAFPKDFTLKINAGYNYSVSGTAVTPAKDFTGVLAVQVQVNDGHVDSAPFALQVTVTPVNDAPVITGQYVVTTPKNTPVAIAFNHLKVTDIDSNYPSGFSLKLAPGNNYTLTANTVRPLPEFTGELTVKLSVNDGAAESNEYALKITVEAVAENIPPVITGQKAISSIVENSSRRMQLSDVSVTDPDNKWPTDFTLKVLPGENYAVEVSNIRPLPGVKNTTLTINVVVNDGEDDSLPYGVKIEVVPSSIKPVINGQKEVTMAEDASLEIKLEMLEVVDADNTNFPKGFSLQVQPGDENEYTVVSNTITPALNRNDFIWVKVKVSDGVNVSEAFNLSVFVEPVNDSPEIVNFNGTALNYEPGEQPLNILEDVDLRDVDNEYLTLAEIGFDSSNYNSVNDELLISDSTNIKVIYDPVGILFLVGHATTEEYQTAIRSIRYNYRMTYDENGNPTEIISGPRNIYVTLHDGQNLSERYEKQIIMETQVALDIPNTFTPNGDRSNDTWRIRSSNISQLDKAIIRVFNKRGLLLYEAVGFENEWDGVANGQTLPVDTYYYTIDLNLTYMKQTYKGAVTILY